MSKPKRAALTCSRGHRFDADVFRSANVTSNPRLKDVIAAGRFNHATCPACGEDVDAAVPFLYHDMANERLVWVYPAGHAPQADAIREKIRRSREIVGTVLPEPTPAPDTHRDVVFGLDELLDWLGENR